MSEWLDDVEARATLKQWACEPHRRALCPACLRADALRLVAEVRRLRALATPAPRPKEKP